MTRMRPNVDCVVCTGSPRLMIPHHVEQSKGWKGIVREMSVSRKVILWSTRQVEPARSCHENREIVITAPYRRHFRFRRYRAGSTQPVGRRNHATDSV